MHPAPSSACSAVPAALKRQRVSCPRVEGAEVAISRLCVCGALVCVPYCLCNIMCAILCAPYCVCALVCVILCLQYYVCHIVYVLVCVCHIVCAILCVCASVCHIMSACAGQHCVCHINPNALSSAVEHCSYYH